MKLVRQYLKWMETAPAVRRAEAVWPLVRAYFTVEMPEEEREAIEAAMTVLLDDRSPDVRRALAEALAIQPDAPRHLIIALVQDQPDVAIAVLGRSPLLMDAELIDAVATGTPDVQTAIARRPRVSSPVSAAICEVGGLDSVKALVGNPGAAIAQISFRRAVERWGRAEDLRRLLFARRDLPIAARQALIRILTEQIGERARDDGSMPERRVDTLIRDACDKATIALLDGAAESDLVALVEHLRVSGQLSTSLLVRGMCAGHIRFFEAALASLADMPAPKVYAILLDGREASLLALFERASLPERAFPAFVAALEVWRDLDYDARPGDRFRFSRRMLERILTRYQDFSHSDLDDLLAMLRRLAADAAREAARGYVSEVVREDAVVRLMPAAAEERMADNDDDMDLEAGSNENVYDDDADDMDADDFVPSPGDHRRAASAAA
ncbi:DUF2336 domain-containing protein [Methylobrevis pamukkalensis]|uniref:DUF2336 domain-containing protein n=1 Tax=Methylobrevis pamukkalensis TaxID=1439726 RepID=UPI001471656D|nr:DUF2336 domain-containing protein [Methylobrevis pamukkalensis]